MKAFFAGFILVIARITGFSGIGYFIIFMVAILVVLIFFLDKKQSGLFLLIGVLCGSLALYVAMKEPKNVDLPELIEVTISGYRKPMTYEAIWSGSAIILTTQEDLQIGDRLLIETKNSEYGEPIDVGWWSLRRPQYLGSSFSYPNRLYVKGYTAHIRVNSIVLFEKTSVMGVSQIKRLVTMNISSLGLSQRIKGLVEGMMIGGRRLLSDNEYEGFLKSGLVHIIAVSGSNILMLYSFMLLILFFVPFYGRVGIGLFAVIFYAVLCGMDSSVMRAMIMGSISILLVFFGRGSSLIRLLQYTAIGMLSFNPYLLWYDLGFLLSYLAVLGIYYSQVLTEVFLLSGTDTTYRSTIIKIVREYLLPILGASLGVFPLLILLENDINLFSIVANILVTPLLPVFLFLSVCSLFFQQTFLIYPTGVALNFIGSLIFSISELTNLYGLYLHIPSFFGKFLVSCSMICIYAFIYKIIKGRGVNGSTSVSEAESLGSNPCVLDETREDNSMYGVYEKYETEKLK